jgi:deoxyadenosine/deoxycytidine kinase
MKRWAFQSQVYFLQKKFALHLKLEQERGVVVQDRSIYEDAEIFAANLHRMRVLTGRDWETYWELYQSIQSRLRPPDLIIFLKCSVRTLRRRIASRARPGEEEVKLAYVKNLNKLYDEWFERYSLSPTVVIESDRLDYLSNLVDRIELLDTISQYLE